DHSRTHRTLQLGLVSGKTAIGDIECIEESKSTRPEQAQSEIQRRMRRVGEVRRHHDAPRRYREALLDDEDRSRGLLREHGNQRTKFVPPIKVLTTYAGHDEVRTLPVGGFEDD